MRIARITGLITACGLALCAPTPPACAASRPVDALFVIDNSGSMKRNDPAFITRQVVVDFAEALPAGSRLGMVVFDTDARLTQPLTPVDGAGTSAGFAKRLEAVTYRGQRTNSPAGVERALYELRTRGRSDASQIVVFLSDGLIDTGDAAGDRSASRWLRETLAAAAARADIRIFGIAFTDSADVELIQTLALATDAEYFRATRAEEIGGVVDQIVSIVGRRSEPPEVTATEPAVAAAPAAAPAPVSAPAMTPEASSSGRLAWLAALLLVGVGGAAFVTMRRTPPRPVRVSAVPRSALPSAAPTAAPMPTAQLLDVACAGNDGMLPLAIEHDRVAIGRDPAGDVVIPRETISGLHATIRYRDGLFHLEDQRSTNGTKLNGDPLETGRSAALKSGDRIDFADVEFRFLLPGREPVGNTVILGGLTLESEPPDDRGNPPEGGPRTEYGTPPEPETEYLGGPTDLGGPTHPRPDAGTVPPPAPDDRDLFHRCMERQLERVRQLGVAYAQFVDAHFAAIHLRELASGATRLMAEAREDHRGRYESFVGDGVVYLLCILPEPMEKAADWFGKHCGGYTALLRDSLDAEPFARGRADTLCVVTYGREGAEGDPWVSLTIAPSDESTDRIDIMSVELLSEDERRVLALKFDDVGRVL